MPASTTRRAILAGTGSIATLVAASVTSLAQAECSDAALLALREPFDRTWRAYKAALDVHATAEAAAWRRYRTEPALDRKLIDAEEQLAASERRVDKTERANRVIVERMCEIPARSIEGLAFKAKVSLEHEDNRMEELVTSIMDDIIAMGGPHA